MKDKKRIAAVPDKRGKKLKRKVRLYMGLVNRTRFKKTVVTGECRFCGQQVMIGHEVPQDEADRIAWKYCGCDGAARELEKEDQYDAAREWVAEEFGGDTAMTALLLDAIEAVLPAGTLSGAPKIRACQLIGELENNKRGIYGGAIGYIDFTGNMDTCIAIRIAWKKNGRVFVRSGGGIVADSVPEKEYQESVNKARAVMSALEQAGEVDE